jgi:hypothetical protein
VIRVRGAVEGNEERDLQTRGKGFAGLQNWKLRSAAAYHGQLEKEEEDEEHKEAVLLEEVELQ